MFTLYYKQRSFRLYNRGSEKSMKRALIITTVSGFVPQFEMNNVRILQDLGYEVHYAANYHMPVYTDNNERLEGTGIIQHQIDFVRSPYNIGKNMKALDQLVSLMREIKFHLVHCHTPMGGVLGRIAAHKTNTKPVIYTAHGFHFYKGAPVWNWLFFYPVERFLAKWTDCLITINKEDFQRAKKFYTRIKNSIYYIHGVGINIKEIQSSLLHVSKNKLYRRYNIPPDSIIFLSIGEVNKNKNHINIIKSLRYLDISRIYYIICGNGERIRKLKQVTKKYDLTGHIIFAGYQENLLPFFKDADIFILPSFREGLSHSLLEAMAADLPIICSKIRGNVDLISTEGKGGWYIQPNSPKKIAEKISLALSSDLRNIGKLNSKKIEKYDSNFINDEMTKIYSSFKGVFYD